MFIDRGVRSLPPPFGERNGSGVVGLYLNSAPPNGFVFSVEFVPINISLLTE